MGTASSRVGDRRSQALQNGQPFVAPIGQRLGQPAPPVGGFGGQESFPLPGQPAGGVRPGLRIMVQLQDQLADGFIASAAMDLDEVLHRE